MPEQDKVRDPVSFFVDLLLDYIEAEETIEEAHADDEAA